MLRIAAAAATSADDDDNDNDKIQTDRFSSKVHSETFIVTLLDICAILCLYL